MRLHDPTTPNRQGNDIGTQYRSVTFYHNEKQKETAEKAIKELETNQTYKGTIVTQIEPFNSFYQAEDCHRNYYDKNRSAGYCRVGIDPKIHKLYKDFGEILAKDDPSNRGD